MPTITGKNKMVTSPRRAHKKPAGRGAGKRSVTKIPGYLIPLVILSLLVGICIVAGTVWTVSLTNERGDIEALKEKNAVLMARSQALDKQLSKEMSLSELATKANELGMVPATIEGTIVDGKIVSSGVTLPDATGKLTSVSPQVHYPDTYPHMYNARIVNISPTTDFPSPQKVDEILAINNIDGNACHRDNTVVDYRDASRPIAYCTTDSSEN